MKKLLALLLLFVALEISGCHSMYNDGGWGYADDSEAYQAGEHHRNSEHDD